MNLMGSRRSEPQPQPEPVYEEPEDDGEDYEDPEEGMVAPAEYSDAVDYFNSLPESVRKMILNSDD
jgi:hypothetical protein